METRFLNQKVELRVEGDESPKIVGTGSVFYNADDPGTEFELWEGTFERFMPGAFDDAIAQDDVRGLFNHDSNLILGRTVAGTMRLSVDSVGLLYEIDPPDNQFGRDLIGSIRRGDVSGSSISFHVVDEIWERIDDREIRSIKKASLFDTGPVTFPAYTSTETNLRSHEEARRSLEAWKESAPEDPSARLSHYLRMAEMAQKGIDLRCKKYPFKFLYPEALVEKHED